MYNSSNFNYYARPLVQHGFNWNPQPADLNQVVQVPFGALNGSLLLIASGISKNKTSGRRSGSVAGSRNLGLLGNLVGCPPNADLYLLLLRRKWGNEVPYSIPDFLGEIGYLIP